MDWWADSASEGNLSWSCNKQWVCWQKKLLWGSYDKIIISCSRHLSSGSHTEKARLFPTFSQKRITEKQQILIIEKLGPEGNFWAPVHNLSLMDLIIIMWWKCCIPFKDPLHSNVFFFFFLISHPLRHLTWMSCMWKVSSHSSTAVCLCNP